MSTAIKKPGWKEIPIGGRIDEAGNAHKYNTGGWRVRRPVWVKENCIHCFFCWSVCPDSAVEVEGGKMHGFDYNHCKGCGLCAQECPTKDKAIVMEPEDFENQIDK
ncbi:MAG: 4Fe-4S binding protein [Halanaerobiales bacterium]|nr:4Fe-4S binding protein [Halanaerobiales bacterium]